MVPEIYEIKDNTAGVKTMPRDEQLEKRVVETVEKCPTHAIVYEIE